MRTVLFPAAALGVAGAAAFLIGLAGDRTALRLLAKPVPVLAMAAAVAASCRSAYGRRIAGGLLWCALGDVLLEVGERAFLAGVAAFLVGHLFFTAAFLGETRALRPWHAIPCALWGIGVVASLRSGLAERGMLWPVAVYTAVICTMLWRAAARLMPRSPIAPGALAALCGALLFVASDTLIAVHRFHLGAAHPAAPAIRYGIILLYWLVQLEIAGSALVRPLRSPSAAG